MTAIKRRFCSHKSELQKLSWCSDLWVSLPQSPSVTAPFSSRLLLAARDQPVRILRIPAPRCRNPAQQGLRCVPSGGARERRTPCLPLMRKVSARLVAMTEGEITCPSNYAGSLVLRNGFSPSVCAEAQPAPPSGGAKRTAYPLPSSQMDIENESAAHRFTAICIPVPLLNLILKICFFFRIFYLIFML